LTDASDGSGAAAEQKAAVTSSSGGIDALVREAASAGSTLLDGASRWVADLMGRVSATLDRDMTAVRQRDPAAQNALEILTCYPGLHALWFHRAAHALWKRGVPVLPRLVSQIARFITGVDIHPGATIGPGFFIDHASGVVIGETAEVGENVTIYQGVTLGGTGKETGKRHPTVGDNVVIGAGANVLGSIVIGDYVKIGSGSVVVQDVPDNSTVVGNPGRPVISEGAKVGIPDIDYTHLPDPMAEAMKCLVRRVVQLENEIEQLRASAGIQEGKGSSDGGSRARPDRSASGSDDPCDPPRVDGTPDF